MVGVIAKLVCRTRIHSQQNCSYGYTGGCKICWPTCALTQQCHVSIPPWYHPFSKRATPLQRRIALAQDSESRHIVIKVLLSDSEEYRVLKFLHQEKELQEFQGVIPVLDMVPFGAFHFAVLPRYVGCRYTTLTLLKFH